MASVSRANRTRTALSAFALFWCAASGAYAEVYRWVDSNGNVHFSDEPGPGAQKIEVPPTTTITLPDLGTDIAQPEIPEAEATLYQTLRITFPEPNSAFHSGDGSFTVTTAIEPALSAAHELRLLYDGQVYAVGQSGQFLMNNVDRGTHTLQLQVLQDGNVIQSSPETQFTIHRPSLLNPNRPKPRL